MAAPYLVQLADDLLHGLRRLPVERRRQHADYLRELQNADGGFSGREGGSDLYYTGFGLRGLAVLDTLTLDICVRAAVFLRSCLLKQTSVVDFFSFLYAALLIEAAGQPSVFAGSQSGWSDRVAQVLEPFRTSDGGYGKTPGARAGSTYHTFLVGLCYELLGQPLPDAGAVVQFIHSRHREDGGFVEIGPMRRSGTNPTAAAVGVLQMAGAMTESDRKGVVEFLAAMPSTEGGLRANGRAPLADLLSTFTGLWTLSRLDALDQVDADAASGYVQLLELPAGGFRGGLWDNQADVEYTFYGLGCLGLLSA